MPEARITFRLTRGSALEDWAVRQGSRKAIQESALGLLQELRRDFPKAQVYINGRRINLIKKDKQHDG